MYMCGWGAECLCMGTCVVPLHSSTSHGRHSANKVLREGLFASVSHGDVKMGHHWGFGLIKLGHHKTWYISGFIFIFLVKNNSNLRLTDHLAVLKRLSRVSMDFRYCWKHFTEIHFNFPFIFVNVGLFLNVLTKNDSFILLFATHM